MIKIVVNACYGGFELSEEAVQWLLDNGSTETVKTVKEDGVYSYESRRVRHNPDLVRCVEVLGERAEGSCAKLEIRTVEGSRYRIREYDGYESVETPESIRWVEVEA